MERVRVHVVALAVASTRLDLVRVIVADRLKLSRCSLAYRRDLRPRHVFVCSGALNPVNLRILVIKRLPFVCGLLVVNGIGIPKFTFSKILLAKRIGERIGRGGKLDPWW